MGFIQQRAVNRFSSELPKAADAVRKYYGLMDKVRPEIRYGLPPETEFQTRIHRYCQYNPGVWETAKKLNTGISRLLRKINEIRAMLVISGQCVSVSGVTFYFNDPSATTTSRASVSGVIYPGLISAFTLPEHRVFPFLVHEMTHVFESKTTVTRRYGTSTSCAQRAADNCALEGLAVLAQKDGIEQGKPTFWGRVGDVLDVSLRRAIAAVIMPINFFKFEIGPRIMAILPENLRKRIANFAEIHTWAMNMISPYTEGYRFAREVSKLAGGPEIAFDLICYFPPSGFREVLEPGFYIQLRERELAAVKKVRMEMA
jgi:hypothetical protein